MTPSVDLSKFQDAATIPNAYAEGISWCAATGIVKGRTDGTFASQASLTRAHLSVMLMRFAQMDA